MLAGGAGERLGAGRPKAAVELGGATLLARAVATLIPVCSEVVIAAPAALALPDVPARRIDDPPDAGGPLAGLVAAARECPGRTAVVLGVDFPLITAAWLEALGARLGARAAVIPAPGGRAQPLVAVYRADALERLVARFDAGERAVTAATASLDADRPGDDALAGFPGGAEALLNVNTPADLARALQRLGGAAHA